MRTQNTKLAVYDFLGLAAFLIPLGGIILPSVYYVLRRAVTLEERNHYRSGMNFQMSLQLYAFVMFLTLPWMLAMMFWATMMLGAFMIIMTIGYKAMKGELIKYPLAIPIFRMIKMPPSYEDLMFEYEQSRVLDPEHLHKRSG